MIAKPPMKYKGCDINLFIFNFTMMFIKPSFQPSSCLFNIIKFTKKTWNETDATILIENWNAYFDDELGCIWFCL